MNEPELGAGIDPGMAFNPFPSSIWIRWDSNPQPLDRESSSLTTRPDLSPNEQIVTVSLGGGDIVKEVAVGVLVVHGDALLQLVHERRDEGVHLEESDSFKIVLKAGSFYKKYE